MSKTQNITFSEINFKSWNITFLGRREYNIFSYLKWNIYICPPLGTCWFRWAESRLFAAEPRDGREHEPMRWREELRHLAVRWVLWRVASIHALVYIYARRHRWRESACTPNYLRQKGACTELSCVKNQEVNLHRIFNWVKRESPPNLLAVKNQSTKVKRGACTESTKVKRGACTE